MGGSKDGAVTMWEGSRDGTVLIWEKGEQHTFFLQSESKTQRKVTVY